MTKVCVCVCVCEIERVLITLRVQQPVDPQVLFCRIKSVFQPVDHRPLPLNCAPIKKFWSVKR